MYIAIPMPKPKFFLWDLQIFGLFIPVYLLIEYWLSLTEENVQQRGLKNSLANFRDIAEISDKNKESESF